MVLTKVIFLFGLILLVNPVFAQNPSAEVLARLSIQKNVGKQVVTAFSKTKRVRVFVAMHMPESPPAITIQSSAERKLTIKAARSEVLSRLQADDFELIRKFDNVSGFAGMANPEAIVTLASHPLVWRIDTDVGGSGNLVEGLALSNFAVRKARGFSGQGVTVAVLDSGYDSDHPDLADSLVREQCFCSVDPDLSEPPCCPDGTSTQSGTGAAVDDNGHGTHVAGIITGNGVLAPEGGAPDADIVAIKVLDENNEFCCVSDVTAALDWIISSAPEVDLVNMSLGTNARFAADCDTVYSWTEMLGQAIDTLKTRGVSVFVSSGNSGSGVDMQAPACIANAISVGAVWDSDVGSRTLLGCTDSNTAADTVACFSNSSTTTDIFAPGAFITSSGLGGFTATYAGTSQASPMVAACAALLLEESPNLGPVSIEAALKQSDVMVTDTTNGLSFPRLDCAVALANIFSDGFEGH